MSTQLPLAVQLPDFASFDNYYVQSRNREPVDALVAIAAALDRGTDVKSRTLHLCGDTGAGKTHLLYALCQRVRAHNGSAMYLSLCDPEVRPEHIEALPRFGAACIDDLGTAAGHANWQRALLLLYERICDTRLVLVTAARYTPSALGFTLPDLTSRV
ncbi:MAG: DnaA regulatory inactivator Hda, partial [Gammaproteobacteria bacterium]|nr:DnaA regulatory inactivator Hda [Gammaproteobacteria bacterium]